MPGLMGLDNMVKFNGVLEINGQKLQVRDGKLSIQGQQLSVSNDGTKLQSPNGQTIGTIHNGQVQLQQPPQMQKPMPSPPLAQ